MLAPAGFARTRRPPRAVPAATSRRRRPADEGGMWNFVLRHRLLLRAIYARSQPVG
jgi:hypothetical protein